jgi:hypothetical protein
MGVIVLGLVWKLATSIVAGADQTLIMFGMSLVVVALVVHILNDWRGGLLLFLLWVLFEDLVRKYLGNSMAVYFAKDLLAGVAYLSFYLAKRKGQVDTLKPRFLVPLGIFIALAIVQVFNASSPHVLYGLLGLKLYFYYVPLMFLGYAMLRHPLDLDRLLKVTLIAGIVICGLGIVQTRLGFSFLAPEESSAELYELSHLTRLSPVTHQEVMATSSVFVSAGRFSFYLVMLWIVAFGAQGYLLLSRRPGAKYGYLGMGVVTAAVMSSGTRTPFVFVIGSAFVMTSAFLWGAPWRWGQGHRLVKALRRGFLVGGLALILMVEVLPDVIGGNWAFFSETLSLQGEGSELVNRGWTYPLQNLRGALGGDWLIGYGTGMSSLGMQYVARFLNQPMPPYNVESGYGSLVVEMGIGGLILWVLWVSVMLWQGWKVVRKLRETVYFPLGFAIWWNAVVALVLLMYFGMQSYQNYVNNAYLWLLIGVLYRLPKLAEMPQPVPIPTHLRSAPRWRFALAGK